VGDVTVSPRIARVVMACASHANRSLQYHHRILHVDTAVSSDINMKGSPRYLERINIIHMGHGRGDLPTLHPKKASLPPLPNSQHSQIGMHLHKARVTYTLCNNYPCFNESMSVKRECFLPPLVLLGTARRTGVSKDSRKTVL
jgi:hypothetical protein